MGMTLLSCEVDARVGGKYRLVFDHGGPLAIPFHVLKGEASVIWMHALIAALSVFVAWGRWRNARIAGR